MTGRLPGPLIAYRAATTLLSPLAPALLAWRARKGKEDSERLGERRGRPSRTRPEGDLVWAHGASIGETQALLPVVEALVGRGLKVLVTSGTRTSAEILGRRLPPGARHQYVPLDIPHVAARFLDHWRPHLALFAESEIWPNLILELERNRVPLVLVNGRVSARSFAGWHRAPGVAGALFGRFALCVAQSEADADRLRALGARQVLTAGNLKFDIAPLPANPAALEILQGALAGRTIWMAASTHPGEEEEVIHAHLTLRQRLPGLLTLLAPRHPGRGDEIAEYAASADLAVTRRSHGGRPEEGDLHLIDTVGDLGLFYRLAPLVLMGGSLVPHGGQNPIEPARLGAAILHGPHVANFAEVYAALDRSGGAVLVEDGDGLVPAAERLLGQPAAMRELARAASTTVGALGGALARTLAALAPYLPPPRAPGEALW